MVRLAILAMLAALAAGCGPDEALPPSVAAVPADAGTRDAGLAYEEACSAAHCIPALCEPLDGGTVRCGVACGAACTSACAQDRCDDADAGWVDVFCNTSGASLVWTRDASCDDGNSCTKDDVCQGGTCAGTVTPGVACDDGNACTTGDACDPQGKCRGAKVTAGLTDRFYQASSTVQNYAYGPASQSSWWTNTANYTDQGAIYASVPNGQTIKECRLQSGSFDRLLVIEGSTSGYTCDCADANCDTGKGATTPLPGTVPLRRFNRTGANQCGGLTPCGFYTTASGSGPANSTEVATGIYVCPP